jgi:predicted lipoprotein with Yx(FWY)xxD motif
VSELGRTVEQISPRVRGFGVVLALVAAGALAASAAASAAPAKASGTKIGLRSSPHGKVLDGAARKYAFVHISATGKNVGCSGVCPTIWPMVKTTGKPRAGNGVKAKRLGQTSTHQVTYHGHPLFYYAPSPQDPSIDGAHGFGGTWKLINAKGKLR